MVSEALPEETYEKINQELRRGILVLAVLSQLHEASHGYALLSRLAEHGLTIDQGTLYPLLRRLEDQGLLESQWNTDGSRPRRYYQLSPTGRTVLQALSKDWQSLTEVMARLLSL